MLHFIEIANHPTYLINKRGDVYNTKTKRILKHSHSNTGYYTVFVEGKNRTLHRLLAMTFIPNPDNLPCINHKDGNKLNNELSNLEWCNHSHNNKHAYDSGLKKYAFSGGEHSANHKLTESNVIFIRNNYKPYDKVCGAKALAIKYGVSASCISMIARCNNWKGDE